MQKLLKVIQCTFFITLVIFLFSNKSYAGSPAWTLTPDPNYPTTFSITSTGTAVIKYLVTNQSHKMHTLVMKSIPGITQVTTGGSCPNPFILAYHQSCTLNLLVDGSALSGDVKGGPIVCQQGSTLECYQPSALNALNITFLTVGKYLITPLTNANGVIYPNTPQIVAAGSSLIFTATPSSGYQVDQWLMDGGIAQKGGSTFTLSQIDANHTVEATFTRKGTLYVGAENGAVYFSNDNGLTWAATHIPSAGNAVKSVFANETTLYVGSEDGLVYYSTDNGVSWNATTGPSGAAVNSVFVVSVGNNSTIYSGTQDGKVFYSINNGSSWIQISGPESSTFVPVQNIFVTNSQLFVNTRQTSSNTTLPPGTINFEYTYSSDSLTNPSPTWTLLSQISFTLFVNSDGSMMYAGTQDGYIFSLTTGDELGFITYTQINSLFFLG